MADDGGGVGGKIKQNRVRCHAGNQAVDLVQCHRLDLGWPGQRGQDHIRSCCELPWCIGPIGTRRQMWFGDLAMNVMHGEPHSSLYKICGKTGTLSTQANQSNLGHLFGPQFKSSNILKGDSDSNSKRCSYLAGISGPCTGKGQYHPNSGAGIVVGHE